MTINKQFRKGVQHIASFQINRLDRKKRIQDFLTPKEIKKLSNCIARQTEEFIVKNLDKLYYSEYGDNNIVLKGIEYEPKQNRIEE